ncbi:FlgD immunoglobulin-like domain containing protein [Ereboglobus luteus]|uniref:FlgD/Vpr Ig-like domain-containing protein n=1 Tax=Ereboglobus luteus TaxID=1796921 RepID=A0A2U8E3E4_9BACT|nr:FlgD immunoglobulin-like domain containing protein [Ereboglobus luteus]AWI09330.1 hypothetical protein CKA38_08825 [Ereboglobus luteus]
MIRKPILLLALGALLATAPIRAADDDSGATMSYVTNVTVVPAPGAVTIDGRDNDWDLSAGMWSYNSPELVDTYSIWTHMMWDEKGIYYLARIHDIDPLKNASKGVDFDRAWRGDAVQLRTIFDNKSPDEHQIHITLYYSTAEQKPYMLAQHGGWRDKPPYDNTGPARPDLTKRFGNSMEAFGGKVAMRAWDNGKGYNMEAFMPWSYLRLGGKPIAPGGQFVIGWETMWAANMGPGDVPESSTRHRLADGVNTPKANRIFMFRARDHWGSATISNTGNLNITAGQRALQQQRLAALLNLDTAGSIAINYTIPAIAADAPAREVTIAIDNARGERVRNLIAQYPRTGEKITDYWDGLDDAGKPVAPGSYTAVIADHAPVKLELLTTVYNAGTPPWLTLERNVTWGSDHGSATSIATHGKRVVAGFSMPEAGRGMSSLDIDSGADWSVRTSASDIIATDDYIYAFEFDIWQKKYLVTRIDAKTGRTAPFVLPDGRQLVSRELDLPLPKVDVASATAITEGLARVAFAQSITIALGERALWLLLPENKLYKIDIDSGQILENRPAPGLRAIRSRNGNIYAVLADKTLWQLNASTLERQRQLLNLSAVSKPVRIGVSQDERRVAVCDAGTNQVFVYDLNGDAAPSAIIGKPKPGATDRAAGPFDRDDVMLPVSADFDARGRIWIAEGTSNVHRVSVWKPNGSFDDEYWGASPYGATHGYAIPHDPTRFIAMGLEFKVDAGIDSARRKSAEIPLYYHPALVRTQGQVRRVTDAGGRVHEFAFATGPTDQRALIICRRAANGEFVPATALFPPIDNRTRRDRTPLSEFLPDSKQPCAWIDKNGNGCVERNELITAGIAFKAHYWSPGWVRPDMTIFDPAQNIYPLQKIDANGVPVYDFKNPRRPKNTITVIERPSSCGTPLVDDAGNITDGISYHTADGRRGAYPNPYGRWDAPAARAGLLIAPFRTNGVIENIPGVGSATMLQGDRGQWFMMSFDGLYLTSLFQDIKGIVTMDATHIGGESFGGHVWRVTDGPMKGKVLVQSGQAYFGIFEVKNLDTMRRQTVALKVTADDIARGRAIAASRKKSDDAEAPLVITKRKTLPSAAPATTLARGDALAKDTPFTLVRESGNDSRWFKVSLLADKRELALAWQVADPSPWKNGADNITHAFIGGDALDLKLDIPGRGPVRLLTAKVNGEPRVIYWQKSASKKENPQTYVVGNNLSNARNFDIVKILPGAKIDVKIAPDGKGYTALVRIPLADIGLDGKKLPEKLRGVAGVIYSDASGTNRAARLYWHDKATDMVNDVPTESDVNPARFGEIEIK